MSQPINDGGPAYPLQSIGPEFQPEESTPPIWKENYLLQKQYIEELEREIDRLNMRILSLEVAGQNVVYQATEMWKRGAIKEWLDLVRKEEVKP